MATVPRLLPSVALIPSVLLLAATSPVWAQCDPAVDPVFLAEGPVTAVGAAGQAPDGTATAGTVTAMGVLIHVPATAAVNTPTATLTMAEFADPTAFPGRTLGGFLGATVIVDGCVKFAAGDPGDPNADPPVPPGPPVPFALAETVFSDVAENVMLGVVTVPFPEGGEAGVDTFEVNGTPVSFLTDPRMPANPIVNAAGAVVTSASLAAGADVAVEGYYGDDGTLHVWSVGVTTGVPADPNAQITITRYRCDANDLRVQGGISLGTPECVFAAPYSVALFDLTTDPATEIQFAPGNLTIGNGVAPDPQFCTYSLRIPNNATCPNPIEIRLLDDGTSISSFSAPL